MAHILKKKVIKMWYNDNDDIINAFEEIVEDFKIEYYDPEENDDHKEVYLKDLFAGARIRLGEFCEFSRNEKVFKTNHYAKFVEYMKSVNYDAGYGSQNFFGFVLLSDDTWFERYSYDGQECWVHKKRPELNRKI